MSFRVKNCARSYCGLYSAWEAQDFEALRDMVSTSAHVLVIGRPASGLVAHTVAARNL
jgi:hypothetical protein